MADLNKPAFYPRVGNITPKPRAPLAQTEVREQPLDPIMRVFKDLMDRSSALLDKSKVTPFDVTKGLISAIPFEGERFAKDFDKSTMPVPIGFGLLPKASPQGIDTSEMGMQSVRVPTKEALNELKWSDLVGTAGASRMFEALGQNRTPELFDTLDATMLGLGGLSAVRAAPKVAKAVGEGAKTVGMGGLEMIDRGMFGEGPLRNFVPQHKFVIKPKGGNWLGGDVEKALDPLITKGIIANREIPYGPEFDAAIVQRIADLKDTASMPGYTGGAGRVAKMLEDDLQDAVSNQNRVKDAAINKWVQSNLTNYVKKDMGTPDDPVRKLAEQDISHLPQDLQNIEMTWTPEELAKTRKRFGFPEEETATNPTAKMWEQMADEMIAPSRATEFGEKARQQNPWLEKLNPYDTVYETMRGMPQALKFDHIVDVLREDIAAGRIRPEQLNKVSMEQAVRRTYEYDQELARKMEAARQTSRAELPVYKEYPEGLKWVELNRPGDFASESNAMGHSVRGYEPPKGDPDWTEGSGDSGYGGYGLGGWNAIKRGDAKVYSLVDSKGEPHVTVEVGAFKGQLRNEDLLPYKEAALEEAKKLPNGYTDYDVRDIEIRMAKENMPAFINQIKGKQNAKPKDDYMPFVQDFVRDGNWSDVRDFQNTGLDWRTTGPQGIFMQDDVKALEQAGYKVPKYLTTAEKDDLAGKLYELQTGKDYKTGLPKEPPAPDVLPDVLPDLEGIKRGGRVSISNNPDTMMMELGNQKFGIGGLATVAKNAKKAAKVEVPIKFPTSRGPTAPEIRAMAERMAPQVMGEFVRAAPTPSNPKPSTNVVGKTQKQFEREKTLPIEYENIKEPVTPEEFDYAKKKGALLIGAQGDVTPGNRMLLSIDEQPLSTPVHLQAGPEWELYNPSAWAATDQMAKTWMNRAGKAAEAYEADPYLHYHKMTPDANWYAMHHFNSILGHLRPEELKLRDPKLYQQMLEEIRTKDVGFGKHPEFEGFDDPLNLQIHAQMDPNFRRHIGAIFGGPKFTQRYGLNSGQDVLAATSLPELRNLEAGAGGYAVVPLDVKAPLRHFEADSQTYDTGFPKAGASGRSKYPMPYQLMYRDTLNWMKDVPSENKSSEFGRMNMIVPKQKIDDELIDAIGEYQRRMKELTGKKKGGAVHKAEGGEVTGDDLILEERPL